MTKLFRSSKSKPVNLPKGISVVRLWVNGVLAFVLGAVVSGGVVWNHMDEEGRSSKADPALPTPVESSGGECRSVAELIALTDAELARVDIVEMNLAVAREIPGLEGLDYDRYRQIVDQWTEEFRQWLPTVEHAFRENPQAFHNDINFFRLGMLAQFLDQQVGVAYVLSQKNAQLAARDAGQTISIRYTDPRDVLLHGLIDTRRGTCVTMPALHVAIGRRLGWPAGLACVNTHYVCRYDDGERVYNIEATDTGRGGFSAGSDEEYIEQEGVSPMAISSGSDLRKLTAREMLGVFIQSRGRHYADTDQTSLAAQDYALAHTLFPRSRRVYIGLVGNLLPVGELLFAPNEHGHPMTLASYLQGQYRPASHSVSSPTHDPFLEIERLNAINARNRQLIDNPPAPTMPITLQGTHVP
jgi:hypothetical protein